MTQATLNLKQSSVCSRKQKAIFEIDSFLLSFMLRLSILISLGVFFALSIYTSRHNGLLSSLN